MVSRRIDIPDEWPDRPVRIVEIYDDGFGHVVELPDTEVEAEQANEVLHVLFGHTSLGHA